MRKAKGSYSLADRIPFKKDRAAENMEWSEGDSQQIPLKKPRAPAGFFLRRRWPICAKEPGKLIPGSDGVHFGVTFPIASFYQSVL